MHWCTCQVCSRKKNISKNLLVEPSEKPRKQIGQLECLLVLSWTHGFIGVGGPPKYAMGVSVTKTVGLCLKVVSSLPTDHHLARLVHGKSINFLILYQYCLLGPIYFSIRVSKSPNSLATGRSRPPLVGQPRTFSSCCLGRRKLQRSLHMHKPVQMLGCAMCESVLPPPASWNLRWDCQLTRF